MFDALDDGIKSGVPSFVASTGSDSPAEHTVTLRGVDQDVPRGVHLLGCGISSIHVQQHMRLLQLLQKRTHWRCPPFCCRLLRDIAENGCVQLLAVKCQQSFKFTNTRHAARASGMHKHLQAIVVAFNVVKFQKVTRSGGVIDQQHHAEQRSAEPDNQYSPKYWFVTSFIHTENIECFPPGLLLFRDEEGTVWHLPGL